MKDFQRAMTTAAALLGLGLSVSVGSGQTTNSDAASGFGGIKAPVRASRDATLGFTFPVEVAEVLVKGGQKVHKGDLLIRGQDEEYLAQRDLQKTQADSNLDVQKAQTAVDQAQIEYDNWKKMVEQKLTGSQLEYDRARTLLAARVVDLNIAKLQHEQAAIQLRVRQAQLDRVYIRAPFDGIVDNVLVDAGDVKRDTEPVLKLVSTEPLWMDVQTPTDQCLNVGLKAGDKAWIVLEVPGEPAVYIGKVIEVGAEADFGGRTLRIRVELPNPAEFPAGIQAWVRFTQPEGEWAKRLAPPRRAKNADTAKVPEGAIAEQAKK